MIVCSCNVITRRDVESVIEEILVADPYAVLTPNLLYHRFPHVTQILVEHGTLVRQRIAVGEIPASDLDEESDRSSAAA